MLVDINDRMEAGFAAFKDKLKPDKNMQSDHQEQAVAVAQLSDEVIEIMAMDQKKLKGNRYYDLFFKYIKPRFGVLFVVGGAPQKQAFWDAHNVFTKLKKLNIYTSSMQDAKSKCHWLSPEQDRHKTFKAMLVVLQFIGS